MTDIHTHLMPTADDGSASFQESLLMLITAYKCGVKNVVVTPHCNHPEHQNNYYNQWYVSTFNILKKEAADVVPINLYAGMEIYLTTEVPKLIEQRKLISINDTNYILVEFPFDELFENMIYLLSPLFEQGLIPIIAHPERYNYINKNSEKALNFLIDMGCVLQVNRGSLLGRFGKIAQKISWNMLNKGLVHVIASDAHSQYQRTTYISDAYNLVCSEYDDQYADLLFKENPYRIINNENLIQRRR